MSRVFAEWEKEAIKCIRCGACQNVCPVFNELRVESTVARGKIRLIRTAINDELDFTDNFSERINQCLLCKACVANCPSGVNTDKLVEAVRWEIVKEKGLSPLKKLIFRLALRNKGIFDFGLKMGSFFQKILFRPGPGGNGMLPRLPMGLDRRRLLKPVVSPTLRQRYPEVIKTDGDFRGRVAFFTGCMINYIYTGAGRAVIEVLNKNGYEVVLPAKQHCCGTPVRVNGDRETAVEMAKANIRVFAEMEVDAVITACASCGLALKQDYPELMADNPKYLEKAKKLAGRTRDFSEFIVTVDGWDKDVGELPLNVTYHDPCHLARGQGIRKEPRQIIQSIRGIDFQELPKKEVCCGSAGSFSLHHYDLSTRINNRKMEDIRSTGAETVVTACHACQMHVEDGLHRNGMDQVSVMHVAELLNMAYKKGGTETKCSVSNWPGESAG